MLGRDPPGWLFVDGSYVLLVGGELVWGASWVPETKTATFPTPVLGYFQFQRTQVGQGGGNRPCGNRGVEVQGRVRARPQAPWAHTDTNVERGRSCEIPPRDMWALQCWEHAAETMIHASQSTGPHDYKHRSCILEQEPICWDHRSMHLGAQTDLNTNPHVLERGPID